MSEPGSDPAVMESVLRRGRRGVIQLVGRNVALRAITLAGTVVLARLLEPADYGLFAITVALAALVGPLGELGLGPSIVQQEAQPTRPQVNTAWTVHGLLAVVLIVIAWFVAPYVQGLFDLPGQATSLLVVAVAAVVLAHLQSVPGALLARQLRFGMLAGIEIVSQTVYFSTAIALALRGAGAWSLVGGLLSQYAIGSAMVYVVAPMHPVFGMSLGSIRNLVGFGVRVQAVNYLGVVRESLVPILGPLAGGVPAVGQLQFGQRIGRLLGGLDEIAAQIGLPVFSRLRTDSKRTSAALTEAFDAVGLVLALPILWSVVAAPVLVPAVFGDQWRPAVPVFQLVALAALLGTPAQVLRALALATGNVSAVLRTSVVALVIAVVLLPALLIAFGLVGGGTALLIYAAVLFVGYARIVARDIVVPMPRLVRIYALGCIAAVVAIVPLSWSPDTVALATSITIACTVYLVLVLAFERDNVRDLVRGNRAFGSLSADAVPTDSGLVD